MTVRQSLNREIHILISCNFQTQQGMMEGGKSMGGYPELNE